MINVQANAPNLVDAATIESNWIPRINNQFRLQWEDAQNAHVLLYPEGMVKLNDSAGEILSRCDGANSVQDIITALSQKFPQVEDIEQDILAFLADAYSHRWLYHA